MVRRRTHGGGQTWKTFLRNHVQRIAPVDPFTVPTIGLEQLYAFAVLSTRGA
jgi:hypothetical protein